MRGHSFDTPVSYRAFQNGAARLVVEERRSKHVAKMHNPSREGDAEDQVVAASQSRVFKVVVQAPA